jgi:hypothetical protein
LRRKKPYQPVKKGSSSLAGHGLPGSKDNQVGGNIIGALLHTSAAEEAF